MYMLTVRVNTGDKTTDDDHDGSHCDSQKRRKLVIHFGSNIAMWREKEREQSPVINEENKFQNNVQLTE